MRESVVSKYLSVAIMLMFGFFVSGLIYITGNQQVKEEAEYCSEGIEIEARPSFKDFKADEYDMEKNLELAETRAYLRINRFGKAKDNVTELYKLLDDFEATNNAVIQHLHMDECLCPPRGYISGIWIQYQVRPIDYR